MAVHFHFARTQPHSHTEPHCAFLNHPPYRLATRGLNPDSGMCTDNASVASPLAFASRVRLSGFVRPRCSIPMNNSNDKPATHPTGHMPCATPCRICPPLTTPHTSLAPRRKSSPRRRPSAAGHLRSLNKPESGGWGMIRLVAVGPPRIWPASASVVIITRIKKILCTPRP